MLSPLPLTFVTIVETRSISAAARQLNLAKSAVSQSLKRLEQQLGVQLAVRSTRQFSLTPAGERYYQSCKDILHRAQQAQSEMERFGAEPAGQFTLTAPHALIAPVIAPAIQQVLARFPQLTPVIIAEDRRLDPVGEGIDLAISVGDLPDSNLRARRVGQLRDVYCCAPHLLETAPDPAAAEYEHWVLNQPYIAHLREDPAKLSADAAGSEHAGPQCGFRVVATCNTIAAQADLARQGLGIAKLPDLAIVEDLRAGRLVLTTGPRRLDPADIYAVHAYDGLVPRSVAETIAAVEQVLRSINGGEATRT